MLYTFHFCVGIVDEDLANAIEGDADATQNQAEADRDITVSDRLNIPGTEYYITMKNWRSLNYIIHYNAAIVSIWRYGTRDWGGGGYVLLCT